MGEEAPWDLEQAPPDVAVVVALQEEFVEFVQDWHPLLNKTFGGYDYFWCDSQSGYRCVATFAGQMGPDESTHLANRLLQMKPAVLVNIGIAASLHRDVQIGDVVVPDLVYAYDKTAKAIPSTVASSHHLESRFQLEEPQAAFHETADGRDLGQWRWEQRGDAFRVTHRLVEECSHFQTAHPQVHKRWQEQGSNDLDKIRQLNHSTIRHMIESGIAQDAPALHIACLGSGNFVAASVSFANWIRRLNAGIKALEMEAAGTLLAANKRYESTPTLVIRGISDHIQFPKESSEAIQNGGLRRLALHNAWRLFVSLLELNVLPRRNAIASPHPEFSTATLQAFTTRVYLQNYRVKFFLGKLVGNGYRQITVQQSYEIRQTSARLKVRCVFLEDVRQVPEEVVNAPGHVISWVFLCSSQDSLKRKLPARAFEITRFTINSHSLDHSRVENGDDRCFEFESQMITNEQRDLFRGYDVIEVVFKVLQANEYHAVSDRVVDLIKGYEASCHIEDGTDIENVLPVELLSKTSPATITAPETIVSRQKNVSVASPGWILPGGGVSFSWSVKQERHGELVHLGTSMFAAKRVLHIIRDSKGVRAQNTFIVGRDPYPLGVGDAVTRAICAFLGKTGNTFEEICSNSEAGRSRISAVRARMRDRRNYRPRLLKEVSSNLPIVNFLILRSIAEPSEIQQVFFGWDLGKGNPDTPVFCSKDRRVIDLFTSYFEQLVDASAPVPPPGGSED